MTPLFAAALGVAWMGMGLSDARAEPDEAGDTAAARAEAQVQRGADPEADCTRRIQELKNRLDYQPGDGGHTEGTKLRTQDGESHTYAPNGPVEPVESWFDFVPRPTANAVHALDAAMAARDQGNMNECHDHITDAEHTLAEADATGRSSR